MSQYALIDSVTGIFLSLIHQATAHATYLYNIIFHYMSLVRALIKTSPFKICIIIQMKLGSSGQKLAKLNCVMKLENSLTKKKLKKN